LHSGQPPALLVEKMALALPKKEIPMIKWKRLTIAEPKNHREALK